VKEEKNYVSTLLPMELTQSERGFKKNDETIFWASNK
jgi:hypothetical protein